MAEITTPTYTIRFATQSDVSTILSLITELAIYEKEASSVQMTESLLLSTLSFPIPSTSPQAFTPGHAKTLLLAPTNSPTTIAGMALYHTSYSTWTGPGLYLEDLIVTASQRGKGYGTALLAALAREVLVLNPEMGRLNWSVLKWNEPSIKFYESEVVGAKVMGEWVGCRVEGEGVRRLAERR